ncbi:MAG: metallopeptidase family protein [Myxococcales bacterium]|nr:metallopeptidase family protein [Myxococcales bacterium]
MSKVDQAFEEALSAVDEHLAGGDLQAARAAAAQAARLAGAGDPDVLFAEASIAWAEQDLERAAELLQRVVNLQPQHADAHYGLAAMAEERGEPERVIAHWLKVHSLDARADRSARIGRRAEVDHIDAVAHEVLLQLPSPFAERLEHVPVILEPRPSRDLVRSGFDPRSLGLFEGPPDGDHETAAPARIVLFVNNLLAEFPEREELEDEIEVTLLHEIGHYFNLDEDDMRRLGLD